MTETLFKAIEDTLGLFALRVVLAVLGVYIVWEGFLRLWQSIRGFSSERRRLERERSFLEVLKLRCDIEALKKIHGLNIELPVLSPSFLEPQSKPTGAPLARSLAAFLARLGWLGTAVLLILAFGLQFIGVSAAGLLGAVLFDSLRHENFGWEDGKFILITAGVAATTSYLGFVVIRRALTRRAPKISIAVTIAALACAMVPVISFIQTVAKMGK